MHRIFFFRHFHLCKNYILNYICMHVNSFPHVLSLPSAAYRISKPEHVMTFPACPSDTLSTTNFTLTDLGSIPGRQGETPATSRLSHGTATLNTENSSTFYTTIMCTYKGNTGTFA